MQTFVYECLKEARNPISLRSRTNHEGPVAEMFDPIDISPEFAAGLSDRQRNTWRGIILFLYGDFFKEDWNHGSERWR
jgi:hypothetical protein